MWPIHALIFASGIFLWSIPKMLLKSSFRGQPKVLRFKGVAQYIANQKHETNRLAMYAHCYFRCRLHRMGDQAILTLANNCCYRFCSCKLQVKNGGNLERWIERKRTLFQELQLKLSLEHTKEVYVFRLAYMVWGCSIAHFRFIILHFLFSPFFWTFLFGDLNIWSVT